MKQNNLCLEEYLEYLGSQTSAENPLTVSTSSGTYSVWYTSETSIPKPSGDYQISGDNIAGYIITVRV
jgi:D-alanyl-D-alanine carboxypeptidase